VAQVVIVTREHPTELSSKFIGRQIAQILEHRGFKVVHYEMPLKHSGIKKVSEIHKGTAGAEELEKNSERDRLIFLTDVYQQHPDAIVFSFHNSLPAEPYDYQLNVLKQTPDRRAARFSNHKPIIFQPEIKLPRLFAVEIPALFKDMPVIWQKKVEEAVKKSRIRASRQLSMIVDLKASALAGLTGKAMTGKVFEMVLKKADYFRESRRRNALMAKGIIFKKRRKGPTLNRRLK